MTRRVCSIEDCGRFVLARWLCSKHYSRWLAHGDPYWVTPAKDFPNRSRPGGPAEFWARVDKTAPGGCWQWRGVIDSKGYGAFTNRKLNAHRYAHELLVGPIPEGLTLDHLCRNRSCVNPAHLEPVTRGENVLRGETIPARNAAKTHCPQGHPYSGRNLVMDAGARKCRECKNARQRRQRFAGFGRSQ